MKDRRRNRHTALLLALALGMFGFAFALVPLYDVFCEVTGLNGRTTARVMEIEEARKTGGGEREVTIQLLAQVARGMPWEFRPNQKEIRVRVGEMNTTTYYARNRADHRVAGQAVPSVSPGEASLYLKKIECFCFSRQELEAGGEMDMPVRFYVAEDIPAEIRELSLSYKMFEVESAAQTHAARHP